MIDTFTEIGIIIIAATLLAYLGNLIRQPSIIFYIIAGIIIGPVGFQLIKNQDIISLFSELGIVFLLFIVGLELDLKKLKEAGVHSLFIGLGQIIFTAAVGYIIARVWFDPITSLYLAVALTFSSTVVVVKLLSDKGELSTLHGTIALSVLLLQDVAAIFALVFFSSLGALTPTTIAIKTTHIIAFFCLAYAASVLIIPFIFNRVAQSLELLFLTALSIAFGSAFVAHLFDFSPAIGAFIAGIAIANTPYSLEISSRIAPLRDFFVTIFFATLGMQITLGPLQTYLIPTILLSLFVIIGNPFIMMLITALGGYHKRTAFLTSLLLAQISEFSLVLVALGFSLHHISAEIVSITATIATVTIAVSTYFIKYDEQIYKFCKPMLWWKSKTQENLHCLPQKSYDVILCGYNRMGFSIFKKLRQLKKTVLVVDYNPKTIRSLIKNKVPCIYGDISDHEIIEHMNLKHANMLISTVTNVKDNSILIKKVKQQNRKALAVVAASHPHEAYELYDNKADYVIIPHFTSGQYLALLLEKCEKNKAFLTNERRRHLTHIKAHPDWHNNQSSM